MNTATQSTEAVTLTDASDDDLKSMGLPASFTLDSLKEFLEPEEIARLGEGDDPLVDIPDDEKPGPKGRNAYDAVRGIGDDDTVPAAVTDDTTDDDEAKATPAEDAKAQTEPAPAAAEITLPEDNRPDPQLVRANVADDEAFLENMKEARKEIREK